MRNQKFSKSFFEKNAKPAINQASLGKNDIIGLPVCLPSLPEQHRISAVLTESDERIQKEESYREKLVEMKKGLMDDLLTGRVRVPEGVAE